MKQAAKSFHQQVLGIVRKYWPKLVANELIKLSGDKPPKASKVVDEPKIEEPKPTLPPLMPKPIDPEPEKIDLKDPQTYISALAKHGSKVKAAEALGIAETTFRDRYKKAMTEKTAQANAS